jgi:hypothetical protein
MYFVFNRDTLQLEGAFDKPKDDHTEDSFIVLPLHDDQTPFRKTLDRLKVSHLEVALMYRNAGNIRGPISDFRDSLISYLYYLLASGKALTKHTATLFNEEPEPVQAGTGRDRPVANTVAPAKIPSAPRSGNRVTIFEVADRMWNEAGSPKDTSAVLQLRKTIMAELEANNGIKKTTSSTALGEWQKLRLNN